MGGGKRGYDHTSVQMMLWGMICFLLGLLVGYFAKGP